MQPAWCSSHIIYQRSIWWRTQGRVKRDLKEILTNSDMKSLHWIERSPPLTICCTFSIHTGWSVLVRLWFVKPCYAFTAHLCCFYWWWCSAPVFPQKDLHWQNILDPCPQLRPYIFTVALIATIPLFLKLKWFTFPGRWPNWNKFCEIMINCQNLW